MANEHSTLECSTRILGLAFEYSGTVAACDRARYQAIQSQKALSDASGDRAQRPGAAWIARLRYARLGSEGLPDFRARELGSQSHWVNCNSYKK